ncbi:MAG TPA: nucleoside hydrolase-like domain-containing protein, partial [Gemmatimonadaceae bacterium]|nr:nucleoside hydrolase-like domain-containing protein [Gemmatimonadaceae bacterium]
MIRICAKSLAWSISPLILACAPATPHTGDGPAADERPRVVVTTDPELDDSNSLVRYLLFSTDFRTEGLIYASSQFHWKGDGTGRTFSRPNREY